MAHVIINIGMYPERAYLYVFQGQPIFCLTLSVLVYTRTDGFMLIVLQSICHLHDEYICSMSQRAEKVARRTDPSFWPPV